MITDGATRRKDIITFLSTHTEPVNGTDLAKRYGVSRQVIVQDIALLRAESREIFSTNRGYILHQPANKRDNCTDVILVHHTAEQTFDEMQTIVEYGGRMLDVFVDHDLYGQIRADLVINDLNDAKDFCDRMESSASKPLKELTGDCHYHTITAPSEKVMSLIKKELKEKGFLIA